MPDRTHPTITREPWWIGVAQFAAGIAVLAAVATVIPGDAPLAARAAGVALVTLATICSGFGLRAALARD